MATTEWSQVLAARDGSDTRARAALERLCRTYWEPLYAYIRSRGSNVEDASDLTQAYFTEFLDKGFLDDVDPSKGRFRSFLLGSLRHFLAHQRERSQALKRGGGSLTISLDLAAAERRYRNQPATEEMSPEEMFEHRWALTVLDRAMDRLGQEAEQAGTGGHFAQLRQYLTSGGSQVPYREVADVLGMSEGAVKTAVHRLRKRFGECLRAEIGETVAESGDVDDEVRHLLAVVRPEAGRGDVT